MMAFYRDFHHFPRDTRASDPRAGRLTAIFQEKFPAEKSREMRLNDQGMVTRKQGFERDPAI
jgi:hypothetical protein